MQAESITLHQNMGGNAPWMNPNVFTGDAQGNPVTPQNGVMCYLWANVQNDGSVDVSNITVLFFLCTPAGNVVYPSSAHGSGAFAGTLSAGASQLIGCSVPWVPDNTIATHYCLVAVASCPDCPAPPTDPGLPVDNNNPQVGQHNMDILQLLSVDDSTARQFKVMASAKPGYVQISRVPLAQHADVLTSKGIDPNTPEAPGGETLQIVRQSDGKVFDGRMDFNSGEHYDLHSNVELAQTKPGTAALYKIEHYEDGQLVGGVSQVIMHA